MEDEIYKKCVSTEDIYDILDGEASKELCDLFAEHIKTCEKCRHEYENIKRLENALKDMTSEPSADFAKNTLARLKTVKRNPILRITGHPAFKSVTAVAACLLIVFIVCSKGIFGTANEILNEHDLNDQLLTVSSDGSDRINDDYSTHHVYTTDLEKENADFDETNNIESSLYADPEQTTQDSAVGYYVVDESEFDTETTKSANTGEFVPPMLPEAPSAVEPEAPIPPSNASDENSNNEAVVSPNKATSDSGNDSVIRPTAKPTVDDSAEDNYAYYEELPEIPVTEAEGPTPIVPNATPNAPSEIVIETPMASDSGGVTNPTACDAMGNYTVPEYIYIPTVLVDNTIIADAILTDNTSYYVSTEENIRFWRYEDDTAEYNYNRILEKCEDRSAEYADIIKEQQENYVPVEVAPGEPVPVEPMLPLDYGKPTVKEVENGLYMDIIKENATSCSIYWYENGIFYELSLPLEYLDGNETRYKDITLIENPLY